MNNKPSDDDAFLQLPSDGRVPPSEADESDADSQNPAADLIRKKVAAAYGAEPSIAGEITEVRAARQANLSKHQKFILELTNSGKPMAEIQVAWHDYYSALSDVEKHQVWQEFYTNQAGGSNLTVDAADLSRAEATPKSTQIENFFSQAFEDLRDHVLSPKPKARKPKRAPAKPKSPLHSLVFGLGSGAIVVIIVLFSFFNERFIAPFIQPSRSLSNVPLISDTPVGSSPEVIIPKINVEIPVVYGVKTIDEAAVDKALERGVVHYADTAEPGEKGNVVIVGHSSNNIFNQGRYKFAFVLLSRLEPGDVFYLQKGGKRYTYEVYQKKIVDPNDVSVLGTADKPATATLITCDPPGTSLHRLVVTGEQISPSPSHNKPATSGNNLATKSRIIPGNSQSLWSRFWKWLAH